MTDQLGVGTSPTLEGQSGGPAEAPLEAPAEAPHEAPAGAPLEAPAEAPLVEAFNPFFGSFVDDPAPVLARARREEPVFFSPILNSWIVTRYADVVTVVRDPERFSSFEVLSIQDLLSPEVAERFGEEIPMEGTLIGVDPPAHTRLRRIMQDNFTPSRIAEREGDVETVAVGLLETMVERAGDERRADLVSSLLFPLPLTVVLRLIGIPEEELDRAAATCKDWNDLAVAFLSGVPLDEQLRMADAVLDFHHYVLELAADREREPQDDLLSALAAVRRAGQLTDRELLSLIPGLVLAGHETTANLLANALLHVLSRQGMWDAICGGELPASDVVDEALRYDGPVIGMPRIVTTDTELAGVPLRGGERLYVSYWSANRDSDCAADPDAFDPCRPHSSPHLAFGRGIHHCIGAPLARLEAAVAFRLLASRMPGLRLADGFTPEHVGHFFVRKLAALPVCW